MTDKARRRRLERPVCDICDDTGWITVEDPILGGLVDHPCPDCQEAPE